MSFILTGTSDELRSSRALKVIATAMAANVPLTRTQAASFDEVVQRTTPTAKSLALTLPDGKTHIGGSSHTLMRTIGSFAPASKLCGDTDTDKANVEAWMAYIWSSVDLPLEVMKRQPGDADTLKDLTAALAVLEKHLSSQTHMVGSGVTVADIALVSALDAAKTDGSWSPQEGSSLARFYDNMTQKPFWPKAVSAMASSSDTIGNGATTATHTEGGGGVFLQGVPPPVVSKMYRRHRIRIKEIVANEGKDYMDQQVTVAGWTRTTRNANKGQILFVELNDGSTGNSLQCVMNEEETEGFAECKNSGGTGSSFQFVGKIVASQGAGQAVEMQVSSGKLLGAVYGGNAEGTEVGGMLYPMSKKAHTMEFMRDMAHLRPRGRIHAAAMRIRHAMAFATHNFFHNHGFLYIHTPIITCADCEGAGEQFAVTTMLGNDPLEANVSLPKHMPLVEKEEDPEKKLSKSELKRLQKQQEKAAKIKDPNKPEEVKVVGAVDYSKDFFARRANLTVSGQLNVETHACALSDVYTFGPTFRAENSHTARHLSEFWMIEPEIAFADLTDDINLAEDYLKYCVQFAIENCAEDLEFFENNPNGEPGLRDRLRNVLDNPFKRLTYTEAIEILQKAAQEDGVQFEEAPVWGMDLPSEHERYLAETVFKMPVVLTDYPKGIKAFYMKLNDDGKTVAAADVLVPKIGEIIGGSQREHRKEVLVERCIESGLDPKAIWWYLDLRKYGTVPHAGFGLGFERLILFVTGLQNIRDVIPFPRWAGNAEF